MTDETKQRQLSITEAIQELKARVHFAEKASMDAGLITLTIDVVKELVDIVEAASEIDIITFESRTIKFKSLIDAVERLPAIGSPIRSGPRRETK